MQMSKTGESLNGLSHELPNGTLFFFFFQHSERTSLPVLHLFEIRSFIAHEWPLFEGVGVILLIKDLYRAIT